MLFSYYFDTEKTHRMEFLLEVLNFTVVNNATNQVTFNAKITEIIDNNVVHSEHKLATFNFDASAKTHDVDVHRLRIADENKWIMVVNNNKKPDESITVGLISTRTTTNPLGVDITNESDKYTVDLRANTIGIVESGYIVPNVDYTLVEAYFITPEWPVGFYTDSGVWQATHQMYQLSDFKQVLDPIIDAHTAFHIEASLAPTDTNTIGNEIFSLTLGDLGTFSLNKDTISYLYKGGDPSKDPVFKAPAIAITPLNFYNDQFLDPSKLIIEGDGEGLIKITYAGTMLTGSYDPSKTISEIDFTTRNNASGAVIANLDNLIVKFIK
jgi:hypothetical protein